MKSGLSAAALRFPTVGRAWAVAHGWRHSVRRAIRPGVYREADAVARLLRSRDAGVDPEGVRQAKAAALATVLSESLRKVPYYRAAVALRPDDITPENAAQALAAFPFLEKDRVAEDPRAFLHEDYPRERLLGSTSTGSTGRGIWTYRTEAEYEIEMAFFRHHWGPLGFQPGSRIVRISRDGRRGAQEYPIQVLNNRLLVSPYHLEAKWLPVIYDAMVKYRPDSVHAYPNCLETLARFIEETGRPPIACKGVLAASEACSFSQCERIARGFTGVISVNYGLSERTNLAFAAYRPGDGELKYEIEDLYGVTESRCDSEGRPEIVGTSYWNRAMPLIRYRTGDFGQAVGNRLWVNLGRRQNAFITKQGARLMPFMIRMETFFWDYISLAQVVQRRPGAACLRVVPKPSFTPAAGERILKELQYRIGHLFELSLELADDIPPGPGGKREFAVVETEAEGPGPS